MPTYQVAPYRMHLRPTRSDGADTFLLDKITAAGWTLKQALAWTLRSAAKGVPITSTTDKDLRFGVTEVREGASSLSFVVVRGATGIRSRLLKGTTAFERDEEHREDIDFRCLVVFPAGGHHALLLIERVGNIGVASFVHKLFWDTLHYFLTDTTIKIEPLVTAADMKGLSLAVKELTFHLPNPKDHKGNLEGLTGGTGRFEIKYRERGLHLNHFTGSSGKLKPDSVFGVLSDGLGFFGGGLTAKRANELGVSADLTVELPSGARRTFTMGSDEGPAVVYPMTASKAPATATWTMRPDDNDFTATCRSAVTDLDGRHDVKASTVSLCQIPAADKSSKKAPPNWKAIWNVPTD